MRDQRKGRRFATESENISLSFSNGGIERPVVGHAHHIEVTSFVPDHLVLHPQPFLPSTLRTICSPLAPAPAPAPAAGARLNQGIEVKEAANGGDPQRATLELQQSWKMNGAE
ncbi:hypothetical protein ACJRO7_020377 [Eucalyptus globulus]|uniref:Uncharacterized protein n=1 Tax=Eucalyptus globulus TaxID=34317 RepID=A0ABD3KT14_EUCGL